MRLIICFVLHLFFVANALAGSFFVSVSGNDQNNGTSPEMAWFDIQTSINKLSSVNNDTLFILPGNYMITESIYVPPGINMIGYSDNVENVVIEFEGESLPVLISLKTPVKKSWPGSLFADGSQIIKNITLRGHKKVSKGIVCERRNNVKFKNLHVYDFIETGIVLAAYEKDYLNDFKKEKIVGAEISGCIVKECSRLIPNTDYLYTSCVVIGGWYGGSMHHNYIYDKEGDDTESGQALIAMGMTMAKVHDNTMLINNNIRNHWGGVFSVLTGYTSAFEFYNNTVNSGISCEHRIDGEHVITPGTKNIYVHHNKFVLDSEDFRSVQAIEVYVDHMEISHNYFENFRSCIQSWLGNDTLTDVLIHHNVFNGMGEGSAISFQMGGNSFENPEKHTVYEGFKIYNNTIDGYSDAIDNGHGQVENLEAINNVFMNISRYVWNHGAGQSNVDEAKNVVFDNNLIYQVGSFANDNSAEITNTIESNPGLNLAGEKPLTYYFPSGTASAVTDNGLGISGITAGYGGVLPDIGAYEWEGTTPVRLLAPVLKPVSGEYYQEVVIAISDSNDNAQIYYTLDGTIPTPETANIYSEPFNISESTLVNSACFAENMLPSYVTSNEYNILNEKVSAPDFAVEPREYNSPVVVKIESDTEDAKIIYTTDGTLPSLSNGTLYKAPIYIDKSENISVVAFKEGLISSDLVSANYIIAEADYGEGFFLNNDHDSIRYSDHFWNHLSDQEDDYLQDIHACFSQGSYFEYEFTGTGILYLAPRKKDLAEEIEIYIDDELFTVLSLYQQEEVHQDTVFAYSRLPLGKHKIKVVKSSLTGSIALDALVLLNNPTSGKNLQHSLIPDVYPNPVKDNLYVQFSSPQAGVVFIEIYSMGGKRLLQNRYPADQYENTIPVDVAKLSSGMYILGIKFNNEQSFRKIILE